MLTSEQIDDTYRELEKMFVALDPSPEKGLGYIRERLTLCRAMQDRAAEIRLKVNQQLTDVLQRHWVAQQTLEVQPTPENRLRVKQLDVDKQRHATLAKMVGAQLQVLGRTAMDIRLLTDITKEQMRRGEINPNEAPELIKDIPVEQMAETTGSVGYAVNVEQEASGDVPGNLFQTGLAISQSEPLGPESFGGEDFPSEPRPETMRVVEEVLTQRRPEGFVDFSAVVPGVPPDDDRKRVADTQAVSIDDLFRETTHGPSPTGIF